MSEQAGFNSSHPYNADKWTFKASKEALEKKVVPVALKEVKPVEQPKKG
jgi:hypothetical protein